MRTFTATSWEWFRSVCIAVDSNGDSIAISGTGSPTGWMHRQVICNTLCPICNDYYYPA